MHHRQVTYVSIAVAAVVGALMAQQAPVFDVATIKPNTANDFRVMLQSPGGGRFSATGIPLKLLIQEAYNVRDFQITGGPTWIGTERWDVQAKSDSITDRIPVEQLRPMLKALIEDRFQLKAHRETKEMPVYELWVAKGGSKLKTAEADGKPGPMMRMGRGEVTGNKVAMPMLAQMLSQQLRRTVIDKTGLTGEFDFTLTFTPEPGQGGGPLGDLPPRADAPPPGGDGPTIFTAIQEQLGLKVESAKGPVEVIVIDKAEKPTDN